MRKAALAVLTALAVTITCAAFTIAQPASARTRTCAAFRAWDAHRTTANLNRMLTASELAAWHNLALDVDVVYFDVRDHDRTDLPGDVAGVRDDCR